MIFDKYYSNLVHDVLTTGELSSNRTGIDTLFKNGLYMEFDMEEGFPLLTTKKVPWKSAFGEMLGFIRGYTNAADFRKLGCSVWNSNANENQEWLNNPHRTGTDDLGKIYSYRWRTWENIRVKDGKYIHTYTDQLKDVYTKLLNNIDDRRLIIEGWHPAELDMQALPVCHKSLQFSLSNNKQNLDLFIYVRSNDVGLGMPFNVAQYAWLLHLMAKITNHTPGKLFYFAMNYHIYINHIEPLKEQLTRSYLYKEIPTITLDDCVTDLNFLETTELPIDSWTHINNYNPWPNIKMEMAI